MTEAGRQMLYRMSFRLAAAYGEYLVDDFRLNRLFPRSLQPADRAWMQGCYIGWIQVRILRDTGRVVSTEEILARQSRIENTIKNSVPNQEGRHV